MSDTRNDSQTTGSSEQGTLDRRSFMSSALGAAAGIGAAGLAAATTAAAQAPGPAPKTSDMQNRYGPPPGGGRKPQLFRAEIDITDCEVEGKLPSDLKGAFYRTGPDAQYPLAPGNIPFDGEGHVSMFHFENGRVNFRSRYVRNERYLAQEKAGKILFPMYRNPYMDDPSVKGKSRGTHNTHIIHHNGMLLALKEDSPPAAMDLRTLRTIDPVYRFNGQLESATFTAHPKTDSETGNMIAFGYEAKGFATDDVNVFEYTPQGKKVWDAWVKVPYVGMLHDFAVTQHYVVLYCIPLAFDAEQIKRGGIHWSWYGGQPTYFGFFRRGGDGKDIRWIKGPERSSTHVMGCFDDGKRLIVDCEMSAYNPFPFMPMRDGSRWDPVKGRQPYDPPLRRSFAEDTEGVRHRSAVPEPHRCTAAHRRSLQHGALQNRLPALPGPGSEGPEQAAGLLLGAHGPFQPLLPDLSRRGGRYAGRGLLRAAQQECAGRQRLPHGCRKPWQRERSQRPRDPRCRARGPASGGDRETADQDHWADPRLVGAGSGHAAEEGLIG